MIIYQNETRYCLSHHGIKDMRWGIMNGPPYPLSRKSDGSLNRQKQDARKEKTIGNMPESSLQKLKKHAEFDEKTQKMIDNAEKMRQRFDERSAEKLVSSIKEEHAAAKAARAQRKEQRKAEKDAAQAAAKRLAEEKVRAAEDDEKEALRQYIRHNPASIYKYADAFTDQEMDDLISRIDMDRKIKDVRDQELRRYKKYLEEGASAVGTISKGAKDVVDLYNNCANVWNAVGEYKHGEDFKALPTVKNNRGDGDKQKSQTFKQKNPGTVVDDDAAEKKARDKKDKQKQEKSNQNADQKPAQQAKTDERKESSPKKQTDRSTKVEEEVYAHLFEPFTNDDKNHSSVSRKDAKDTYSKLDSNMDKQNFWTTFNNVRDKKIKSNEWTDNDEKNFQIVLDGVIDYYEDHMAHGDLDEDFLEHHGILGMKWGLRRFQNEDGTLTPAGRERYHRMIAENVVKDRVRQQSAVNGQTGLGYKLANKNRNKVYKMVQKEFYETPEGQRLKQANKKVAKISKRTAERDATLEDQNLLGKTVNRLGQNADNKRAIAAIAEQNEAQKAGAKVYEQLREKYKDQILDATIKDLKILEIDDGRDFLEKYIRGDEDATFGKRDKKQERLEAKQVKEARKAAKLEAQKETFKELYGDDYDQGDEASDFDGDKVSKDKTKYIEKVGDGDDARYFYDKDELKAFKQMRDNSKTDEEKDRKVNAWERARDKDLYDLTFLEAVQNSKILDDGDTTALLTEYAKYLDHPYEYFMNEAGKLKSA